MSIYKPKDFAEMIGVSVKTLQENIKTKSEGMKKYAQRI
jgi:hypothetical protein